MQELHSTKCNPFDMLKMLERVSCPILPDKFETRAPEYSKQFHRYVSAGLCIGEGVVMVGEVVTAGRRRCL